MDWEKIYQKALEEVDTTNLGWIALVGSSIGAYQGLMQDIDVLGFSSPQAKNGEALLSFHELTKAVQNRLRTDYKKNLASFANLSTWADIAYNIEQNTGAQPLMQHSLFFTDAETFERMNPRGFQDSVSRNHVTLYGSPDCLQQETSDGEPHQFLHGMSIGPNAELSPREVIDAKVRKITKYLNDHYGTDLRLPEIITPEIARAVERDAYRALDERTKKAA